AVVQDVRVGAAGVFQGVRQDRKAVEGALLVDALGQRDYRPVVPCRPTGVKGYGTEGIANEITQDSQCRCSAFSLIIPGGARDPIAPDSIPARSDEKIANGAVQGAPDAQVCPATSRLRAASGGVQ